MTDFKITIEQLNEVIDFINSRQTLRAKSILQNLEVIELEEEEDLALTLDGKEKVGMGAV